MLILHSIRHITLFISVIFQIDLYELTPAFVRAF